LLRQQAASVVKMGHCNKSASQQKQIKSDQKLHFFVKFFTLCAGVLPGAQWPAE